MPFPSSTPPLQPIRTPIVFRSSTSWNNATQGNPIDNNGAGFNITGTNTGTSGYNAGLGVSASGIQPNGINASCQAQGTNNAQRVVSSLVTILQGGPNPTPGIRWEMTFRVGIVPRLISNAGAGTTGIFVGVWTAAFGILGGQARGAGFAVSARGDAGANWRVYGQDGDLSGAGTVTVDADTGVAYTPTGVQLVELVWGNNGSNNFVNVRINGATVYDPTLPVAVGIPASTTIFPVVGTLRGGDAADVVEALWIDDVAPCIFVDVYP